MATIGWVAVVIVGAAVLAGAVVGITSIPDARRYMRIRRM